MKKILYVVIVTGFCLLPIQAIASCNTTPAGYSLLGEFNDHRYYLSEANFNHAQASAQAASLGGYMASIVESTENDFLRSRINQIVRIGLSDSETEGFLQWDSGEAFRLNETRATNSDENDFANMNFWNGSWELEGKFVARPYILEIECDGGPGLPADLVISNIDLPSQLVRGNPLQLRFDVENIGETAVTNVYGVDARLSTDGIVSGDDVLLLQRDVQADLAPNQRLLINESVSLPSSLAAGNYTIIIRVDASQNIPEISDFNNQQNLLLDIVNGGEPSECPSTLSGYSSMGEFNQHAYFLSDDRENWNSASALAAQANGYLASIGSQAENDFLKNGINEISLIGLNDAASEGNLQWDSNEAVGYQNITGSNSANGDYANMNFWNGGWDFDNVQVARRYIVEIECDNTGGGDLPDLNLFNLSSLGSGAAGSVVSFTFDLNNAGTAIATDSYRIGMFLTDNGVIDSGDPLVGEILTGNTPLGTISDITGAITIPAGTAAGSYVLVIVADSDNVITESNEANNAIGATLIVTDDGVAQCGFETNLGAHPAGTNIASEKITETSTGYSVEAFSTVSFPRSTEVTNYTLNQQGALTSQNGPFDVSSPGFVQAANGDRLEVEPNPGNSQSVRFTRTRPDGSTVFNKVITVNHDGTEIPSAGVLQLESGGFLISGRPTFDFPPDETPFLVRTDANGNRLWQVTFPPHDFCESYGFIEESVSGEILMQSNDNCTRSAGLLVISTNGTVKWSQNFIGDLVSSRVGSSTFSLDGQFIYQTNYYDPQVKVTKLDADTGEVIWFHSLDKLFSPLSEFNRSNRDDKAIILTSDGGIVVGHGFTTPGGLDEGEGYEFGKINAEGETVWFKRLEQPLRLIPQLETNDGGLLFVKKNKQIFSNDDAGDLVILKLNSDGSTSPDCVQGNLDLPDFSSSFRSVSLSVGNSNRTFDIDLSMNANGVGQIDVSTLFVISSDEIPDAQDIRLRDEANSTFFVSPGSQANIGQNSSLSLSFPENTPTGNYFLIAVHDPLSLTDESNEKNNITVSSQTFAVNPAAGNVDVGTGFSNIVPKSAFPSGSPTTFFDINVPTKPNGSSNSFTYEVAYYLSTDNALSADDIAFVEPNINSIFRPSIAPAGSSPSQLFERLVVPQGTAPGNYFLIVAHDPNNEIAETNENNNVFASAQSYPIGTSGSGTIDLELEVSVDRTNLESFKNYTFTMVLTNNGPETATDIRVRFSSLPGKLAFVDAFATKGDHQGWNFSWRDFDLAPNTSATATITYFTLVDDAPITFSADVEAHNEDDIDSTPGNGFNANEDDDDSATLSP